MIRAFSYGGGTQSTAALVLAAQGKIDFKVFLFANVGEDSEHPDTLAYVHDVAMPYAESVGIELLEVRKHTRDGKPQTLIERINATESSVPIPVRMGDDGAPGNRICTAEFKIRVIEKELRRRGATREAKAIVGLGISIDEWQRAGTAEDPRSAYQLRKYPLLALEINRQDAQNIIRAAGLPLPGRSACFFCPFHTRDEWKKLARKRPDLFAKAVALERQLHERGQKLGRGEFYFTRYGAFLDQLFDGNQAVLFDDVDDDDDGCESGYCMT